MFNRKDIKVSILKVGYQTKGNEVSCTLKYRIKVPGFLHISEANAIDVGGYFDFGVRTVVGTARCNDQDQFNKQLGRDIAAARAEAKAYKDASILVQKFVKSTAETLHDIALNFEEKADYIQKHDAEYTAELGK